MKGIDMKIIEGLKQIKDLQRKAEDLRIKISKFSAYLSYETPMYPDQKGQVSSWLQAHYDILKEILRLRIAIQKTNLATEVTIQLGDNTVTKSIAEWIHRRRDLADLDCQSWKMLTDKGLKEGIATDTQGEKREVKIVRCYDPVLKDKSIEYFITEPTIIDSRLETVNAVTDLIE
jgi:hypothetical protein